MALRVQRRMVLRRKFKLLRCLTKSKSVKKTSILMDAFCYINELKLKLEAFDKDYPVLLSQLPLPAEVKVERTGNGFLIKVTSNRGRGLLVAILESFEEMGLNVLHARVSCGQRFFMEAIAEAQQEEAPDVQDVIQAVLKAAGDVDIFD